MKRRRPGQGRRAATAAPDALQGNTLRGLLLNAYAFGTMGAVAGIAAVVAYVGAGLLLVLGILGLRHAKRVTQVAAPATAARTEALARS